MQITSLKRLNERSLATYLLSALAFVSTPTNAQQEWYEVASTDETFWEVQGGSFEEVKTKGGDPIAVVVSRATTRSTKRIDLRKSYVPLASCRNKMGKIVTLDLDGNFRYENDFVVGGGTVASAIAEFICDVYVIRVKALEKKGI